MFPPRLDSETLKRPARHAVRLIARSRLEQLVKTAVRLEVHPAPVAASDSSGPPVPALDDPEAVHDFRVSCRRLRSWLRAFRPFLEDTVDRRVERRLSRLSDQAGRARDLEVQLVWLTGPAPGRSGRARAAALRLADRVAPELAAARQALGAAITGRLPEVAATLALQLRQVHPDLELRDRGPGMAVAVAEALREFLEVIPNSLDKVRRLTDIEEAHSARIAVKRLRYLLEAFGGASRTASGAVRRLAVLQERLGELHDAQLLERSVSREFPRTARSWVRRLRTAGGRGATGRSVERTEADALRARLRARTRAAFRRAERAIRSQATARCFGRVAALAGVLERRPMRRALR
jgi:CHAD domain-containing protein